MSSLSSNSPEKPDSSFTKYDECGDKACKQCYGPSEPPASDTTQVDDLIDHLVFREGSGPNGSGGEVRYWKGEKDITANEAVCALIDQISQRRAISELEAIEAGAATGGSRRKFVLARLAALRKEHTNGS